MTRAETRPPSDEQPLPAPYRAAIAMIQHTVYAFAHSSSKLACVSYCCFQDSFTQKVIVPMSSSSVSTHTHTHLLPEEGAAAEDLLFRDHLSDVGTYSMRPSDCLHLLVPKVCSRLGEGASHQRVQLHGKWKHSKTPVTLGVLWVVKGFKT